MGGLLFETSGSFLVSFTLDYTGLWAINFAIERLLLNLERLQEGHWKSGKIAKGSGESSLLNLYTGLGIYSPGVWLQLFHEDSLVTMANHFSSLDFSFSISEMRALDKAVSNVFCLLQCSDYVCQFPCILPAPSSTSVVASGSGCSSLDNYQAETSFRAFISQ